MLLQRLVLICLTLLVFLHIQTLLVVMEPSTRRATTNETSHHGFQDISQEASSEPDQLYIFITWSILLFYKEFWSC